jgi:hypothetical protein
VPSPTSQPPLPTITHEKLSYLTQLIWPFSKGLFAAKFHVTPPFIEKTRFLNPPPTIIVPLL